MLFVEELVQKMSPFIDAQRGNLIRDIRELPHVDDYIKDKKRNLRVCKEEDLILTAAYFMRDLFPPVRHLLVVDEQESLAGVISIRDIMKFGFRNKVEQVGNLTFLDDEAKSTKVSSLCVPKEEMIYCCLSNDNKIEDVIQEFIQSRTLGRPLGIIPVIKNEGNFAKGEYEVVSYIDILQNWRSLPGAEELKKISALDFDKQRRIEVVYETNKIVVATETLAKGIRSVPVLNSEDKFVGILSDNELKNVQKSQIEDPISSILTKKKHTKIEETQKFSSMVDLFLKYRDYTSLPVLDSSGQIDKIIGYTDILRRIQNAVVKSREKDAKPT